MNSSTQKLFVYGSLAPGRPNEQILADIGGTWERATVKGRLKEAGWAAEIGYPGIVLDDTGDVVEGFVFSSDNLAKHWDELDAFEGSGYERVIADVYRTNGISTKAYLYVLKES